MHSVIKTPASAAAGRGSNATPEAGRPVSGCDVSPFPAPPPLLSCTKRRLTASVSSDSEPPPLFSTPSSNESASVLTRSTTYAHGGRFFFVIKLRGKCISGARAPRRLIGVVAGPERTTGWTADDRDSRHQQDLLRSHLGCVGGSRCALPINIADAAGSRRQWRQRHRQRWHARRPRRGPGQRGGLRHGDERLNTDRSESDLCATANHPIIGHLMHSISTAFLS